ncbi:hypothetical protein HID58_069889 [Brassica napus]|uniref:Uncharacterized protein n=1 Tax=Brassica napus TaxID=3708 RepID=A0ABQ7YX67_BRANA|nr:hypothetical protein HID58_069889 [Brassica napus]
MKGLTAKEHLPWRGKMVESVPEPHSLSSPPYTKKRDPVSGRDLQRRPPFPQRGLSEWRLKQTTLPQPTIETTGPSRAKPQTPIATNTTFQTSQRVLQERTEEQILNDLNEATMLYLNCPEPTEAAARRQRVLAGDARGQTEEAVARLMKQQGPPEAVERRGSLQLGQTPTIPSKEQVMRELQEVTKQYLSCTDPVEVVARRQRVLLGDAEGLLEKTADSIMAAAADQRRPLSPWERGIRSVSPPGIDFDIAMQPSDIEVTPPPKLRSLEPYHQNAAHPLCNTEPLLENTNSPRLKSLIISSSEGPEKEQETSSNDLEVADDEETLQNFKNKAKNKVSKQGKKRSQRLSPNILRGTSIKKRKLSQIQHSPGNVRKRLTGESSKARMTSGEAKKGSGREKEAPTPALNPPIHKIFTSRINASGR